MQSIYYLDHWHVLNTKFFLIGCSILKRCMQLCTLYVTLQFKNQIQNYDSKTKIQFLSKDAPLGYFFFLEVKCEAQSQECCVIIAQYCSMHQYFSFLKYSAGGAHKTIYFVLRAQQHCANYKLSIITSPIVNLCVLGWWILHKFSLCALILNSYSLTIL